MICLVESIWRRTIDLRCTKIQLKTLSDHFLLKSKLVGLHRHVIIKRKIKEFSTDWDSTTTVSSLHRALYLSHTLFFMKSDTLWKTDRLHRVCKRIDKFFERKKWNGIDTEGDTDLSDIRSSDSNFRGLTNVHFLYIETISSAILSSRSRSSRGMFSEQTKDLQRNPVELHRFLHLFRDTSVLSRIQVKNVGHSCCSGDDKYGEHSLCDGRSHRSSSAKSRSSRRFELGRLKSPQVAHVFSKILNRSRTTLSWHFLSTSTRVGHQTDNIVITRRLLSRSAWIRSVKIVHVGLTHSRKHKTSSSNFRSRA